MNKKATGLLVTALFILVFLLSGLVGIDGIFITYSDRSSRLETDSRASFDNALTSTAHHLEGDSSAFFVSDEAIVKLNGNRNSRVLTALIQSGKATIVDEIKQLSLKKVKLFDISVADFVVLLAQSPGIEYVQPNYFYQTALIPNDTYYSSQWNHSKVESAKGWDVTNGSSDTTIAIVDTGVNYNHPDLEGKVLLGYDFYDDDEDPMDENGHGTYCAGIAAAVTNNNQGIAGVSWESKILAVRIFESSTIGLGWQIAEGFTYAADHEADVISLSGGAPFHDASLSDAVNYAYGKGCVIAAAMGNTGGYGTYYPVAYPHVLGVGATTQADEKASFSTYGPGVDVVAPGVGIWSAALDGSYGAGSGTSAATPHVAGLAALLLAEDPTRTNDEVETIIQSTVDDLGEPDRDDYFGYGRINVRRALADGVCSRPNGSVVKASFDNSVYYIENGTKRWIDSPTAFTTNGFGWNDIAIASAFEMASYTEGNPVRYREGTLLKSRAGSQVYMVGMSGKTYQKRWISSSSVFGDLGFSWSSVRTVSGTELLVYVPGLNIEDASSHPDGALVKTASSPDIYLLENGSKRWITSQMAFITHNFRWGDVAAISDQEMATYETGPVIRYQEGTLIKSDSSPQIYFVEYSSGQYDKRWIASGSAFTCLGLNWSNVLVVAGNELAAYNDGNPIQQL